MSRSERGLLVVGDWVCESRFRVRALLGRGSFGEVYAATDADGRDVALKVERTDAPHRLLRGELRVCDLLMARSAPGFPRVHWYGRTTVPHDRQEPSTLQLRVLAMDLLGPSLRSLFRVRRGFGLKTVLLLADQMLERVQALHDAGFVHRDIKPDNFLMQGAVLHLIDFGLAHPFLTESGAHIPYREDRQLTGTPRYASVNAHMGVEQSRRDDLEALGYVWMSFLRGDLPWEEVEGPKPHTRDRVRRSCAKLRKHAIVGRVKRGTGIDELCAGHPREFADYFRYVRLLYFEDRPDYARLRRAFRSLAGRLGFAWDYEFDWDQKEREDG